MATARAALHRLLNAARQAAAIGVGSLLTLAVVLRPNRKASERARKNAEELITACRAFQARHGRLPDSLEELIPDFLPALPPAKYDGPHFGFTYDTDEHRKRHVLGWTEVIPFGRPYYVFEEDRWGYLD